MNHREQQIFDLLCEHGDLSIHQLSALLHISPSSVRRDLGEMRNHRFIQRKHGGVTLANVVSYNPLPIHKPPVAEAEARAIAHRALQLIEQGDVVGLSGGKICTELAQHMRMLQGVTVVTNAVNIAAELVALPGIQVLLTGGYLDPRSFELTGRATALSLDGVRLHKYFVGTDGITVEHGMTNHNEAVATAAREFIQRSDQTIVLADSSKFQRSNLTRVAETAEVSAIITSDCTPRRVLARFRRAGVKCLVAPCADRCRAR